MSSIAPNSEIYLLKCPLEADNLNQLNFASLDAQLNYFKSLPKLSFEKYTYIRKDSAIKLEGDAEQIMRYNYVMYKNTSFGNKWIFAFITNVTYLNNNVCSIQIKTDVFNTWYFDVNFRASYIEREHTNNDAIGANILNEEIGSSDEYVINASQEIGTILPETNYYYIAMQCSDAPAEIKDYLNGHNKTYSGIAQGCWTVLLDNSNSNFKSTIEWFDFANKTSAIIAMYILPKEFAPSAIFQSLTDGTHSADIYALPDSSSPYYTDFTSVSINSTIDGYTPKNNRLFCYPYNYISASNHSGNATIYKWEYFTNHTASFRVAGIPNQGCDRRLLVQNYKNSGNLNTASYDYGLTGGKLPLMSWKSDYYLNWQAQNGINSVGNRIDYWKDTVGNSGLVESATSLGSPTGNGATDLGNLAGWAGANIALGAFGAEKAAAGALSWASTVLSDIKGAGFKAYMTPDSVEGCANVGDLNFSNYCSGFCIQKMSINAQMAAIVDNYFSMFGYKTMKVKTPNINGRLNWNYVKTKNCNITGDIPQVDMQELKAIFNTGVTIWHNPTTYLDYSQNNNII